MFQGREAGEFTYSEHARPNTFGGYPHGGYSLPKLYGIKYRQGFITRWLSSMRSDSNMADESNDLRYGSSIEQSSSREDPAPDLANNSYLATIRATLMDGRIVQEGTEL